jgi:hypothetical protein
VNDGVYRKCNLQISVVFIVWVLWSLRNIFWTAGKNVGATVSALLAGIVLVDLLAVGGTSRMAFVFVALFIAARLFQKFIPAT